MMAMFSDKHWSTVLFPMDWFSVLLWCVVCLQRWFKESRLPKIVSVEVVKPQRVGVLLASISADSGSSQEVVSSSKAGSNVSGRMICTAPTYKYNRWCASKWPGRVSTEHPPIGIVKHYGACAKAFSRLHYGTITIETGICPMADRGTQMGPMAKHIMGPCMGPMPWWCWRLNVGPTDQPK